MDRQGSMDSEYIDRRGTGIESEYEKKYAAVVVGCFKRESKLRKLSIYINESRWFNGLTLFLILLNTLLLAMNDYSYRQHGGEKTWRNTLVEESETVFLILFTLEAIIKIIALGFIQNPSCYLRNGWNTLDFFVVVIGLIGLVPGITNLTALRAVRVLRPLRSINTIPRMKRLVLSLLQSLPALVNVIVFLMFIFMVFGIVGINLFKGSYYQRCRYSAEPVGDEWRADPLIMHTCSLSDGGGLGRCPDDRYCGLPGDYDLFDYRYEKEAHLPEFDWGITNFNNLAEAIGTILQVITLESWTKIMYNLYDLNSPILVSVYFSLIVLVGSFFLFNLLLATIWLNFDRIRTAEAQEYECSVKEISVNDPTTKRRSNIKISIEQPTSDPPAPERNHALLNPQSKFSASLVSQIAALNASFEAQIGQKITQRTQLDERNPPTYLSAQGREQDLDDRIPPAFLSAQGRENDRTNSKAQFLSLPGSNQKMSEQQLLPLGTTLGAERNNESCSDSLGTEDKDNNMFIIPIPIVDKRRIDIAYFRQRVQDIVESKAFMLFITLCILTNTAFLAADRWPISDEEVLMIESANLVFFFIFLAEMILKILGMGVRGYCQDHFNIFDGVIVILSTIEVILFYAVTSIGVSSGGAISAFRAFRILRVFKLVRRWKSFTWIMDTVGKSLADIKYFMVLLLLFVTIYTLLGMELFAHEMKMDANQQIDSTGKSPRINFDNFFHAFLTIFIVLVGDDWQLVYFDAIRSIGYISSIYFVSLIILGNFILLNLFLAILVGNFDKETMDENTMNKAKRTRHVRQMVTIFDPNGQKSVHQQMSVADEQQPTVDYVELKRQLTGASLCIFSRTNPIRVFLHKIIYWPYFDNVILVLIIISSILLALDNPLNDPNGEMSKALQILDIVMTVLFTMECGIKIIVMGFIANGRRSYLRDGWNRLDFFIVLVSLASLGLGDSVESLNNIKALRTLRVLRPLRLISRNKSMKLAINSLLRSTPSIGNVLLIWFFFFLLFGIVAVNYFKGSFYYWNTGSIPHMNFDSIENQQNWIDYGGAWLNKDRNFDNSLNAMLSLFIMATAEGWIEIMHGGVDAVGVGKQPKPEHAPAWSVFFAIFILIGSVFIMNLLVGIVIFHFNREKQIEYGEAFLTPEQREFIDLQFFILKSSPIIVHDLPTNKFRRFWFYVVEHKRFDPIVFICIILNTIVLGLSWYGESETQTFVIEGINVAFSIIFTLEALMKLLAWGRDYFREGWNIYDLLIVMASIVEIVVVFTSDVKRLVIVSLFRIFRICRIIRLAKSNQSLRVIFSTFILSLAQMLNIGSLQMLFIYIYTILGVQLFAKVKLQGTLNVYSNFQEFWKAFMMLVRVSTGEGWSDLMFSTALQDNVLIDWIDNPTYDEIQDNDGVANGCGSPVAYVYFVSFVLVIAFIFVNLFICIIFQGYETASKMEDAWLTGTDYMNFRKAWSKFDPKGTQYIETSYLLRLLGTVEPPLGFKDNPQREEEFKYWIQNEVDIPVWMDNYYYFYEVAMLLSTRFYEELSNTKMENDQPVFKEVQELRNRKNSAMQRGLSSEYNSREIYLIMKVQAGIRRWIARTRVNQKRRETIQELKRQQTLKEIEERRNEQDDDDLIAPSVSFMEPSPNYDDNQSLLKIIRYDKYNIENLKLASMPSVASPTKFSDTLSP